MQEKKVFATILSALVVSIMIFLTLGTTTLMIASGQQATNATGTAPEPHEESEGHAGNATAVRDSTAVLLSGETIPGGSFIHLYDSTPDAIATGHIAAKIPCDENSNATLTILTGQAPALQPTELELLPEPLSTAGELCLYHADLASEAGGNLTTDIAIQNPGEEEIELPPTSTVVIGVNKVIPGSDEHHEEGAATQANMTQ
jgi:hypothetical protein